ncbi:hypothetical protein AWB76_01639 [Caballeronia temeraria]|uniref:Uncharacterized protein n=1 Tax=Caballeronia temeraria TaxID=1777137 RepID=A0A158A2J9_9BURK|nr:hypothetical protein AWB76_01639 [Caballeronia temeraria]
MRMADRLIDVSLGRIERKLVRIDKLTWAA